MQSVQPPSRGCLLCLPTHNSAFIPHSVCVVQVTYAEEQVECRRVQLLQHFGEAFDPVMCKGTCDLCKGREASGENYEMQVGGCKVQLQGGCICKVGQNRIYTPSMTVYWVFFLPNTSYSNRIYIWFLPTLCICARVRLCRVCVHSCLCENAS